MCNYVFTNKVRTTLFSIWYNCIIYLFYNYIILLYICLYYDRYVHSVPVVSFCYLLIVLIASHHWFYALINLFYINNNRKLVLAIISIIKLFQLLLYICNRIWLHKESSVNWHMYYYLYINWIFYPWVNF
jgi:hypothetical protein